MIKLEKLVFNSFQVNTYILHDESRECVIIDPACYSDKEKNALADFISQHDLNPVLQINTHCHIDHVLGMQFIKEKYKLPIYAHEDEIQLLKNGPLMGELFGFIVDPLPSIDKYIKDQETIHFGKSEILALHVPGHSKGSLAYYSESDGFVITGDALFSGSIGRTDLPGGDYDTLINSIENQLFILPSSTSIWPGHGESSTIENEIQNNPFFK